MSKSILVRGAGDVGSAVAHGLLTAGYRVAIHDVPAPQYSRRGMAFVDAIYEGAAVLAGIRAKKASGPPAIPHMLACGKAIPITTDDFRAVLDAVRPDVLVDARMDKRAFPEDQLELAPLTIGLGPNFTATVTTHLAVETAWGPQLGRVVASGKTLSLEGEPRELGGHARKRFVYAPVGGTFTSARRIGEWIESGEVVACLSGADIHAPLSGFLRGLTRPGIEVRQGAKVVEIDPRRVGADLFGLGERPRRIAEGVLRAIRPVSKV
jgi:xanthine dehydrogenase accessory factor